MSDLRDYQKTGAAFLATVERGLLADAPRVGKTAAAIAACDMVGARKVLWITTGSARQDHQRAWVRFQQTQRNVLALLAGPPPETLPDVLICSYDQVIRHYERIGKRWDAVVLDEVHKLKGRESKRTEIIYGKDCKAGPDSIVGSARYVFALSGTPAPNNYAELWPFLRAVVPNVIREPHETGRPLSYWPYTEKFCRLRDDGFGIKIVGNKNADELKRRLAPVMLRRTLDEIAPQVPKIQSDVLLVGDKAAVRKLRDLEMDERMAKLGDQLAAAPDDATRTLILHAATAHLDKTLPRLTGQAKIEPIVDWLLEEMPQKIVIFGWHTSNLAELWRRLGGSLNAVLLDGATAPYDRGKFVERFQTDPRCNFFVGQILAAGEAIDLSAADEVLFAESSWVPGHNEQAALRVVNINKTRPTLARFATIAGSIDERIQRVAADKLADLTKLFTKEV